MPVLEHFRLKAYPFTLTPNPSLFFPCEEHKAILSALLYAVQRGDGILKVVGEVGTGKTLLCRLLLRMLEERANTAYLNAPVEDRNLLPFAVCREFGIEVARDGDPYHALNAYLLAQHAKGRRNILVVDEAQALGRDGLETIRLLSNLETDTSKLLQIVMFGQVELDRLLRHPSLRQVAQRVNFSFRTRPLTPSLVRAYVQHRVDRCSVEVVRRDIFEAGALAEISSLSGGVPRIINLLADKAMLAALGDDRAHVGRRHVRAAIADSPDLALWIPRWRRFHWPMPMAAAAGGAIAAGAVLVHFLLPLAP